MSDKLEQYTLFVHTDESINAYPDGTYTWNEALKRMHELLKTVHSVTLNDVRHYRTDQKSCTARFTS